MPNSELSRFSAFFHGTSTAASVVNLVQTSQVYHTERLPSFSLQHVYHDRASRVRVLHRHTDRPRYCSNRSHLALYTFLSHRKLIRSTYLSNLKSLTPLTTKIQRRYKMSKSGWFVVIMGHPRSLKMAPFDRAHTSSY